MNKKSFVAGFVVAFLVGALLGMGTARMSPPAESMQVATNEVVLILDKDFGEESVIVTGANVGPKYPQNDLEKYVLDNAPQWEALIEGAGASRADVIVHFHASPGCVYFQGKIYC